MYKLLICDDDNEFLSSFVKKLENQLKKTTLPNSSLYELCPCLSNGKDALEYLDKNSVDVIFLDIIMPDMNGFEVAKIIRQKYKKVLIVFVTAFDDTVYDTFAYSPFAFLRKNRIDEELPLLVKRINETLTLSKRIISNSSFDDGSVDVRDILFFESDGNYYLAYMKDGNCVKNRGTISNLEKEFGNFGFFRTHSGFLVNMYYIENASKDGLTMYGGRVVPISAKRRFTFFKAFAEYQNSL